jgi:putative transposase
MPEYRRNRQPGGTFFFTVVTYKRKPIFESAAARGWLRLAFQLAIDRYPFKINAICLLPDHIHCIWTLPVADSDYSLRWSFIKSYFTHMYKQREQVHSMLNETQLRRREGGVWQRRFWEHTIRDEVDLERHIEYIHYNPVRHGLVKEVGEWKWSSFHKYVENGWYPPGKMDQPPEDIGFFIDPGFE